MALRDVRETDTLSLVICGLSLVSQNRDQR